VAARKLVQSPVWKKALAACADPARARAALDQLGATTAAEWLGKAGAEQARLICALLAGSQWAADMLKKHPDWLAETLDENRIIHSRRKEGLKREVEPWLVEGFESALAKLCAGVSAMRFMEISRSDRWKSN